MAAPKVTPFAVPLQEIPIAQPTDETYLDESGEFGHVSAETREMLEADFFASLREGAA